jgi:hypothetical protein
MKTKVKKIIIIAAALLFVGSGVSFAHDWNDRDHKPSGKAYGHYQVKKLPPGLANKNFKPNNPPITKRYVYKKVRAPRYYDDHHWRPAPRRTVIYKPAKRDPIIVFKVILKDFLK